MDIAAPSSHVWSAAALVSIAALRFRRFRRFVEVQLLCTNDTHSQIDPFLDPSGRRIGGVIRRAVCFDRLREGQTVTLDAGDHLTGSAFFDFFLGRVEIEVLRRLGYNWTTAPAAGARRILHTIP